MSWSTATWVQIASVGSNSRSDTIGGLSPNATFTFRIGAFNPSGTSWTNIQTISAVAVPTLTATPVSSTQVDLTLNTVAGASGYTLSESVNGVLLQNPAVMPGTTVVGGLSPNTTYVFQVAAYNGTSIGWSNSPSALTLPSAPSVNATAVSTTQINLSWTEPGGAGGFVVDQLVSGLSTVQLASLGGSSNGYAITGLTPGYHVRARGWRVERVRNDLGSLQVRPHASRRPHGHSHGALPDAGQYRLEQRGQCHQLRDR